MTALLGSCGGAITAGHLIIEASVALLGWTTWISGKRHGEAKAWSGQDRRKNPRPPDQQSPST